MDTENAWFYGFKSWSESYTAYEPESSALFFKIQTEFFCFGAQRIKKTK